MPESPENDSHMPPSQAAPDTPHPAPRSPDSSEEALRRSDERHQAFFQNAAVGMAEAAWLTGRFIRVNRRLCRMTGYSENELNTLNILDLTHPDDRARNQREYARMYSGEVDALEIEKRYLRKDGSTLWVRVNVAVIRDANGRPYNTSGVIEDVTDRRKLDDELRQIASLPQENPYPVLRVAADATILFANAAAAPALALWGTRVGAPLTGPLAAAVTDAFRLNRRADVELPIDGRIYSWALSPIADRGHINLYARDITDQRRTQQQLRETSERLKWHIENSPLAVVEFGPDLTITRWTDSAHELFGWTAAEAVGKNMWDLPWIPPEDRDRIRDTAADLLASVERNVSLNRNLHKNGATLHCEWYNSALRDRDGKLLSIFSQVLDVTARVAAQTAAQTANAAKDQFLAVLSHELRTPLTPVLAAAEMLERNDLPAPEQRDLLRVIRRNVELETKLIDDLLDLTRISRGKLELSPAPINLHEKIRNVKAIVDADIAARNLAFSADLAAAQPHLLADGGRIQQILWNLLKNAVKFTPAGGAICVRTADEPNALRIDVWDTGCGIEPHILPALFKPFEQGGIHVTRQFGGLGLGLAISKSLVELHGGSISAASPGKNQGSTFTVLLPRSTTTQPLPGDPRTPASPPPAAGARILLVEDNADTLRVMKRLFETDGYRIDTADAVAPALPLIHAGNFDLLVSDIGLPDGSGLDIIRLAAQLRPTRAIALSGFGMEEDIRRSLDAGFQAHLTKPVNVARLADTIRQVLASTPT